MNKLQGKDLDKELVKRAQVRKNRIENRTTLREAALNNNMNLNEYMEYEFGYNICPHKKYEDSVGGVPFPKLILKRCKKCGMVDSKSIEKVDGKNIGRTFKAFKKSIKVSLKKEI